jgi:DNA repair protein RadC
MASDLQIIDGFERLREGFLRENPEPLAPASPPASADAELSAEQRVVEAWLQALDPRLGSSPPQRRRLRALRRASIGSTGSGAATPASAAPPERAADARLLKMAPGLTTGLRRAREQGLSSLAPGKATLAPPEEAVAWGRLLPGLAGLASWRFLERLGRPVVVADAPLRRLLWRLGMIEDDALGAETLRQCHVAIEKIACLTGMESPFLAALLGWHVTAGSRRGWRGGGLCVARPRCPECPLRPACAWARFHPSQLDKPPNEPANEPTTTVADARRLVAEGRQDQAQDLDLLAVLLPARSGGAGERDLAEGLLRRFGGMRGLERASATELAAARGMTRSRAILLKAALELGRRLSERALEPGDPIRSSEDVWRAYRARFRNLPQECFVIVLLDAKNRVIQDHVVSKGTLNGSLAHPREVFRQAVAQSAAGVILLHNHPSGDSKPSPEDHDVTERLREAGEIIGIKVLDHIILGANDYYSFKDEK